jgi:tetratricopeptide (TPR) repeat protein
MRLESANGWGGHTEFQQAELLGPLLDRLPGRVALIARSNPLLRADSVQAIARGIDLLREAVQKYPDDADAWYYLGEAYTHNRPHVSGIGETDAVEAFSRAIALDESYTPAYFHLLHQAFADVDSAHAGRLLHAYRRFAPEERSFELPFALAFGPGARDVRIRTAILDTASTEDLFEAQFSLANPRFQAAARQLLQVLRERQPGPATQARLVRQDVIYGRIEEALAMLDDPHVTAEMRHSNLYILYAWELPIPVDRLDREMVLGATDTLLTWDRFPGVAHAFHAGAYAAERGRWNDHATAISRLGEYERRLLASDDQRDRFRALHTRQLAQALEGLGLWRQGRREDALRKFEAGRWLANDGHGARYASDLTISFWLGILLLEMGRPADAVPVFRDWFSFSRGFAPAAGPQPLASFYLGKAYAAMNEHEKARDAYEFFAESWREADPELQPMVQEARQASLRLQRE